MVTFPIFQNFSKNIFSAMFSALQYSSLNYESCLLLLMVSFLLHFNKKWNQKREILKWNSNIHFFVRQMNDLFDMKDIQISKEILQMVIWSENVFEGNLMLQFSWLEEFRWGMLSWTLDQIQYKNSFNDGL